MLTRLFMILDSLGGLERKKMIDDANKETKVVKADQGTLQKEMKRMLKMFLNIVKRKDSVGIMAGHFFGNPNSYGGADEIGGGKFAKLAPDIIISMKRQAIYSNPDAKASERITTGSRIKAITLKNRFYPPFQEATVQIDYKNGINSIAGLMDILLSCGIIVKSGSWFKCGEESIGQGEVKAAQFVAENTDRFLPMIEEVLQKTGYSTVNEDVVEAEKLAELGVEPPVEEAKKKTKAGKK